MKAYCYYCESEKWLSPSATRCEQCGSSVAMLINGMVHAQVAEMLKAQATLRIAEELKQNVLFQ